jgi:hypothetical protein
MNGRSASNTNRRSPAPMRRSVFSASGFFRAKIDGHGSEKSMHSAAVRHGCARPFPCVGVGHTIGWPSQRAMRKSRFRIVGAPKSHARSSRHSTA